SGASGGGDTGGAGGGVMCALPSDCPGSDTECAQRTCTAGQCGVTYASAGTPLMEQTPGDCLQTVCDGAGSSHDVPEDTDIGDDGNDCTSDGCDMGTPVHAPVDAHTACAGGVCDGQGSCVGCVDGSDCASDVCDASSHTCSAATCMDGVRNEDETDADCGGATCPRCVPGKVCAQGSDCDSGVCTNLVCQQPACDDTVQNGTESDVDCGGSCGATCALGQHCNNALDCESGRCNLNHACTDPIDLADASSAFTAMNIPGVSPGAVSLPDATVGVAYTSTVTISGGDPPYTITTMGGTPSGISTSTDATHLYIDGTPTSAGERVELTLHVDDTAGGTADRIYNLRVVAAAPSVVAPATLAAAKARAAYSTDYSVTNGTSPFSWSIASGAAPGGLSLGSSGVPVQLAGTPSDTSPVSGGDDAGNYAFVVRVTDSLTDRLSNAPASRHADSPAQALYVKTSYRANVIAYLSQPQAATACTVCHNAGFPPNFWGAGTDAASADASGLLGVGSATATCGGHTYVVAGDPNSSLVLGKIDDNPAPCGSCMPAGAACQAEPQAMRDLIRRWIQTDIVGDD
ncbi:MAG TPA: hypothetical protein VHB21_25210, partial [Minicystis sp.]|nr:hypothetical protein [Minicystis sp.]